MDGVHNSPLASNSSRPARPLYCLLDPVPLFMMRSSGKKPLFSYLYGSVCEVHDDRLGRPDPPFDLRYGRGVRGARRPQFSAPAASLAPLSQVLVHVLGEVPQQGELLVQRGRHVLGRHRGHAAALGELNVAARKRRKILVLF